MISVIIPTLNEAGNIADLLGDLTGQTALSEVVVVDGGSTDRTREIAAGLGARIIRSAPGRGRQIAAGAQRASGEILLFLHADSRFPPGGLAAIARRLCQDPGLVGGNFRLRFDGGSNFARWLTGFYAWIRKSGLYYGDSGVFVRRAIYQAIGGMRPLALMEDYDFNRRLERAGRTCCIDKPALTTSSRRFDGRHPAAIVTGWLVIHALFYLGVSPDVLARLYKSRRH